MGGRRNLEKSVLRQYLRKMGKISVTGLNFCEEPRHVG